MNALPARIVRALGRPRRTARALWWHLIGRWYAAGRQRYRHWCEIRRPYPLVTGLGPDAPARGRALLGYVVEPFLPGMTGQVARSHANYWKATVMVECLNELGFQVDVTDWRSVHAPRAEKYELVMGQARAFRASCRGCRKNVPRIFLGYGPQARTAVEAVATRARVLRERTGLDAGEAHPDWWDGTPWATDVFYVGNDFVRDSYAAVIDAPLRRLPNPIIDGVPVTLDGKDFDQARRHFLWLAAYGPLRRGLDVLLEVFQTREDCELWVCGDLRSSAKRFFQHFERQLLERPNIHYMGWVDVAGEEFVEVTRRCGYLLYPSVADGMPGSVVNTMAAGVVPIVTPGAGIDVLPWGIEIPDLNHEQIHQVVTQAVSIEPQALSERAHGISRHAWQHHSQQAFRDALKAHLTEVLARFEA